MRWYEGDIAQAVSMSKSKNAVFVVYIEGKDEKSTNLTSLINDNDVSATLESEKFVAIKVEAGSISHNQFAAIYKTVPVPSIFFIGKSGKPIDIVVESSSANDLTIKINSIIEKHTGVSPIPSPTTSHTSISSDVSSISEASITNIQQSTSTKPSEKFIKNEQQIDAPVEITEKMDKPSNVSCENGVCHIVSDTEVPTNTSTTANCESSATIETQEFLNTEKSELSTEEKIERAKELLEIKREAKKKEEEENARLKEIERRKSGQDVQKLRRWQQDQELKNLMEERQRAKNEEKADRERILAQIAQDKADRAVKFGTLPVNLQQAQSEVIQRPTSSSGPNSNRARLQFKLPDGSSRTHNFDSNDTLQAVRDFILQNLELPFKNFTLSTTFPRREFTSEDADTTLRDLELVPNAVILVLPSTTSAVEPSQGGGVVSLIWFLLSPILGIFGYIRSLIFGQPEGNNVQPPPDRLKRNNSNVLDDNQQAPKRKATESTVVRRQGNIHRLSDRTDSDDDNNTWNGNSTQQM